MFRIVKQIRKERKDIGGIHITIKNQNILIEEQDKKERWKKYFQELLNKGIHKKWVMKM